MRIRYDEQADILTLVLREEPPVDAIEEPGGVVLSYGEDGEPVSVEFLNALERRIVPTDHVRVALHAAAAESDAAALRALKR